MTGRFKVRRVRSLTTVTAGLGTILFMVVGRTCRTTVGTSTSLIKARTDDPYLRCIKVKIPSWTSAWYRRHMTTSSRTWRVQFDVGTHVEPYVGGVTLTERNFTNSQVDEVVIDNWFHLEALDDDLWYLRIGDRRYHVRLDNTKVILQDQDEPTD